ncbi:uncharacterized protein LOC135944042 isoform X1 [Cloeon dipterum]|uniref:uncharacterized protein LOC135944042 isoform X1 n=1 Tax=Cloeon dipterum TaxID=197152 RepID=UPI0032209D2C
MQQQNNLRLNRLSLPPQLAPEAVQRSPTLARVHRATLKLEEPHLFNFTIDDEEEEEDVKPPIPEDAASANSASETTLIKGPLITPVQGIFFKSWKERYFLLTRDFLSCFKMTARGPSTMGAFLFKIRLAEIKSVEWSNSRSDALGTITLNLGPVLVSPVDEISRPEFKKGPCMNLSEEPKRPPIQLRAPQGVKEAVLYDWFEAIEEAIETSKLRRAARSASFGSNCSKKKPSTPIVSQRSLRI